MEKKEKVTALQTKLLTKTEEIKPEPEDIHYITQATTLRHVLSSVTNNMIKCVFTDLRELDMEETRKIFESVPLSLDTPVLLQLHEDGLDIVNEDTGNIIFGMMFEYL